MILSLIFQIAEDLEFNVFPDEGQQLLLFFVLGAFQVEAIKHKWKKDENPCVLCAVRLIQGPIVTFIVVL